MEALAAVALAGNVIQFVQFVAELISTSSEMVDSVHGAAKRNVEIETVFQNLSSLSSKLHQGTNPQTRSNDSFGLGVHMLDLADANQRDDIESHIRSIGSLAVECEVLCERLLDVIRGLRVQGMSRRRFKSFIAVLKTVWSRAKIQDLEARIRQHQETISQHFLPLLR